MFLQSPGQKYDRARVPKLEMPNMPSTGGVKIHELAARKFRKIKVHGLTRGPSESILGYFFSPQRASGAPGRGLKPCSFFIYCACFLTRSVISKELAKLGLRKSAFKERTARGSTPAAP